MPGRLAGVIKRRLVDVALAVVVLAVVVEAFAAVMSCN